LYDYPITQAIETQVVRSFSQSPQDARQAFEERLQQKRLECEEKSRKKAEKRKRKKEKRSQKVQKGGVSSNSAGMWLSVRILPCFPGGLTVALVFQTVGRQRMMMRRRTRSRRARKAGHHLTREEIR
jgi:hypothetical protein